jgi:hypothetical protein
MNTSKPITSRSSYTAPPTYLSIKDTATGSHPSTEYLPRLARTGRMWYIELRLQQFFSTRKTPVRVRRCDSLSIVITDL